MKRNIYFIILALAAFIGLDSATWFTAAHAQNEPKTVLDFYNRLSPQMLDGRHFKLMKKGSAYLTLSLMGDETGQTVDLPNGYIQIHDSATGGDDTMHEIALYKTSDGKSILAVNCQYMDGILIHTRKFAFYAYADSAWSDVTGQVMPDLSPAVFLKPGFDGAKLAAVRSLGKYVTIFYKLPRHGTAVTASIDCVRVDRVLGGHGINPDAELTKSEQAALREICASVKYREIDLTWDTKGGKFSIGKKKE